MLVIVKSLFSGFSEFWTGQELPHAMLMNVLDEALFSVFHDSCSSLQPPPLLIYFFCCITKHLSPTSSVVSFNPSSFPVRIPPKCYMTSETKHLQDFCLYALLWVWVALITPVCKCWVQVTVTPVWVCSVDCRPRVGSHELFVGKDCQRLAQ